MIDVDFFKRFNDRYGHLEGDACLCAIARSLRRSIQREGELAARYGGEEFAVLLPSVDLPHAVTFGQLLCSRVLSLGIPHATSAAGPVVTISIGAAALVPHDPQATTRLLALADQALYQAKAEGRNRTVAAPSETSPSEASPSPAS